MRRELNQSCISDVTHLCKAAFRHGQTSPSSSLVHEDQGPDAWMLYRHRLKTVSETTEDGRSVAEEEASSSATDARLLTRLGSRKSMMSQLLEKTEHEEKSASDASPSAGIVRAIVNPTDGLESPSGPQINVQDPTSLPPLLIDRPSSLTSDSADLLFAIHQTLQRQHTTLMDIDAKMTSMENRLQAIEKHFSSSSETAV